MLTGRYNSKCADELNLNIQVDSEDELELVLMVYLSYSSN